MLCYRGLLGGLGGHTSASVRHQFCGQLVAGCDCPSCLALSHCIDWLDGPWTPSIDLLVDDIRWAIAGDGLGRSCCRSATDQGAADRAWPILDRDGTRLLELLMEIGAGAV
ncbi:hypothetical protein ACLOJK_035009 [Asimina triloba]